MAAAVQRIRASEAIVDLRVAITGTAAGSGVKGGRNMLDDLHRDLKRSAKAK